MLPVVEKVSSYNPSISHLLTGPMRRVFEDDIEQLVLRVFGEIMSDEVFTMCIGSYNIFLMIFRP